jgi:predicted acetyltransferase
MLSKIEVDFISYEKATASLTQKFIHLLNTVWPNKFSHDQEIHPIALSPVSFFLCREQQVISYCVALSKEIVHEGNTYKISGLHCVCTHPLYRKQRYASQVVKKATEFIENSSIDIGLFSCEPELLSFYKNYGWLPAYKVHIVSGKHSGSLSNDHFGKITLIRLFSKKAIEHKNAFSDTTIHLDAPLGKLW